MVNCCKVKKKIDVIYVGKTVLCNKLSKKRELKSLKDAMTGHKTNVSNDKMSKFVSRNLVPLIDRKSVV